MNAPVKPIREGFVAEEPAAPPKAATLPPEIEQPEPVEEQPFVQTWPIKVKLLHRAIRDSKNREVREISFREPSAADIGRYGNPTRIDSDGNVIIVEAKMMYMMAALSGILVPFIEQMDTRDWNSCAFRLRGFFLPDPSAW